MDVGLSLTPEVTLEPRLEQRLRDELNQYYALKQRMATLEADLEQRRTRLLKLHAESGQSRVTVDGFTIAEVPGARRFDRRAFVAAGGDLAVYDQARIAGKPSVRITMPGEKEREAE